MTTEDRPHIVYRQDGDYISLHRTYADAFRTWKSFHHYKQPFWIATVGRVIDPSGEIIDPNE